MAVRSVPMPRVCKRRSLSNGCYDACNGKLKIIVKRPQILASLDYEESSYQIGIDLASRKIEASIHDAADEERG